MGELRKLMADGRKQLGTQTFEQHLAELIEAGTITAETAKAALSHERRARASGQEGREAGRFRLSPLSMPTLDQTMARVLALAREAGTPAAAAARDLVAAHLEGLGYRVDRQRFAFAPSSLNGFPVFGAGLGGLALLLLPLLTGERVPGWGAALVLAGGLLLLAVLAVGIGLGWLPLGGGTREDANLIATRGDVPVRRWIVAPSRHQGADPVDGRTAGGGVGDRHGGRGAGGAVAGAARRHRAGAARGPGGRGRGAGGCAGGSRTAPGYDRRERETTGPAWPRRWPRPRGCDDPATGILITGAEEFGLVGARVFVAQHAVELREAVVVNLDTIDQEGELAVVSHDARGAALARREAPRLAASGLAPRLRRLPVGILTDSLPFARAGVPRASRSAGSRGARSGRSTRHGTRPTDLSLETAIRVGRALAAN